MSASPWRSIDESPARRPLRQLPKAPAPPVDRSLHWMETAAVWLGSVVTHAVLGCFLVLFYIEVQREPEQTYSVTLWRTARGKDVLRIGAPEEGPPTKGVDEPPAPPPKVEEPPKVEPPAPAPEPAPAPAPVVKKDPEPPAPPPPKVEPEGGAPEPVPAAPALGAGASAGVPKADQPGLAKPSGSGDVTEADIDKDPTGAIRRRRMGALSRLREGSRSDIVVVNGAYDHIQDVLDRLEIPYVSIEPEDLPRYNLGACKILLLNCHNNYAGGFFRVMDTKSIVKEIEDLEEREAALRRRIQETKEKRKVFELGLDLLKTTSQLSGLRQQLAVVSGATEMIENLRKFVQSGGYVFTSDWGLSILERAFPGTVKNGGNIGPRTVSLRPHAGSRNPLLDEVFYSGPSTGTVVSKKLMWEVDSASYMIKIEKPSVVDVLVETGDVVRNPAVAVTVTPEHASGKVLHILSHFQRQATKQGDYALQNLLLNFLLERIKK